MHPKKRTGLGAIIAALCIVIYLFALVQAAVRIYFNIEENRSAAEQEFSKITAAALLSGRYGFMDERFISAMNNALAASNVIEALIVTGPEGEYAFERQQGHAVTWVNNSPRFINKLGFSNQGYYNTLPINDLRNANIKAVAGAYNYSEIQKILKETLLLILIGFALAFFTMLIQILIGKPEGEKLAAGVNERTTSAYLNEPQKLSNIPETPAHESASGPAPKGLYSPRSDIGWEEYIIDRLDSELHRCASTENDLTLILMEFADLTNDTMFKQAAAEAVSFFSSRDLLFEYGKYGIAVILPGLDLETGISKSEKFHQRVMVKFPNSAYTASNFNIGLSSRSGRLLSAERLMLESREALSKSKHDQKTSIIAFQSDLEKYRAFIASQS
ncbi:MAG: hypothetical protein LBI12_07675 [Treponema sp.]|jgi:GGDEF domain-containing protein|nr:hypothetical protein [Treponema sp.]